MLVLVFIYLCLKVLKMCINSCNLEEESIIIKKTRAKNKKNNPNSKITSTDVTIATLAACFRLKNYFLFALTRSKRFILRVSHFIIVLMTFY